MASTAAEPAPADPAAQKRLAKVQSAPVLRARGAQDDGGGSDQRASDDGDPDADAEESDWEHEDEELMTPRGRPLDLTGPFAKARFSDAARRRVARVRDKLLPPLRAPSNNKRAQRRNAGRWRRALPSAAVLEMRLDEGDKDPHQAGADDPASALIGEPDDAGPGVDAGRRFLNSLLREGMLPEPLLAHVSAQRDSLVVGNLGLGDRRMEAVVRALRALPLLQYLVRRTCLCESTEWRRRSWALGASAG